MIIKPFETLLTSSTKKLKIIICKTKCQTSHKNLEKIFLRKLYDTIKVW